MSAANRPSSPPRSDEQLLEEAKTLFMGILTRRYDKELKHHGSDLFQYTQASGATLKPSFTVTFTVMVAPQYCNPAGNLHGGAAAMIVDILSSVALTLWAMVVPPEDSQLAQTWTSSGVSRTINMSYLRPAPRGTEIEVECVVASVGKSLALARGEIRSKETGKVQVTFEHHKAAVVPGVKPKPNL